MSYKTEIEYLVKDLVNQKNATIMILSENEAAVADYINEMDGNFKRSYYFNCKVMGIRKFVENLSRIILHQEDPSDLQELFRMQQLSFAQSQYNGQEVILTRLLDIIEERAEESLLVFDRFDKLSQTELNLMAFISQHAPDNLKIVMYTNKHVPFDFLKKGIKYIKLIDDTMLPINNNKLDEAELISNLTDRQRALLVYFRKTPTPIGLIKELSEDGSTEFMDALVDADNYSFVRHNDRYYSIGKAMSAHLKEIGEYYKEKYEDLFSEEPYLRIADFFAKSGSSVLRAFNTYLMIERYDKLDELCNYALHKYPNYFVSLCITVINDKEKAIPKIENAPYYNLVYICYLFNNDRAEEAEQLYNKVIRFFHEQGDHPAFLFCNLMFLRLASLAPEFAASFVDVIKDHLDKLEEYKHKNPRYYNWLYGSLIRFRGALDLPISTFHNVIFDDYHKESWMYIYDMEGLALEYMKLGNGRMALEVTEAIKEYCPFYVIPHTLLAYRYYSGDVPAMTRLLDVAVKLSERYKLGESIDLETFKAMLELYKGKIDEGLSILDNALLIKDNEEAHYRVIAYRCIQYAKYRDAQYAREIAYLFMRYCEEFYPSLVSSLQAALSYSYLLCGDKDKAYRYATMAIQSSPARSGFWLLSMGIATAYMLTQGDLKDSLSLVRNIIHIVDTYGMKMIVVDHYDEVFETIITFAKLNGFESEFIAEIEKAYADKNSARNSDSDLKVTMFGEVLITVSGETAQWKTRKSRDLFLLYLLAGDAGLDRSAIIDVLWKDYLYESAINNLKTTNNIVRNTLKQYGVNFKLDYVNSKYVLKLSEIDNDYRRFCELIDRFNNTDNITNGERINIVNEMLTLYKGDFAADMTYQEFVDERKRIRQEFAIALLTVVRSLAKDGDYLEAKRFLTALIQIDKKNNYSNMLNNIDQHLGFR